MSVLSTAADVGAQHLKLADSLVKTDQLAQAACVTADIAHALFNVSSRCHHAYAHFEQSLELATVSLPPGFPLHFSTVVYEFRDAQSVFDETDIRSDVIHCSTCPKHRASFIVKKRDSD